jgi:hypothetical protein
MPNFAQGFKMKSADLLFPSEGIEAEEEIKIWSDRTCKLS